MEHTYQDFIAYLRKVRTKKDTSMVCANAPCDVVEVSCRKNCPLYDALEGEPKDVHAAIDKFLAEQATP
jgi:hypothetical protein